MPEAAPVDAGAAPAVRPKIEITPRCLEVAKHVAEVIIANAEPGQRSVFEAERDRIERRNAEVCTTQAWSEPAITCFLKASSQAAIKACESKFPPPAPPPRDGSAGSAAPTAPVRGPDGKIDEPGSPGVPKPAKAGSGSGASAPRPKKPPVGGMMPPTSGSGAR